MPSHSGKRSGITRRGAARPTTMTPSSSTSETPTPTAPSTSRPMRRSKKLNPSFDVARADLGGNRVGWVYRSESPVAVADLPRAASTTGASGVEAPEQETARDWIGTGIGALVLPVTL